MSCSRTAFFHKKNGGAEWLRRSSVQKSVSSFDGAGGATVFACAAIDANIGVNNILGVAFGNGGYGAGSCASSAHYAFVRDHMCHNIPPC